MLQTLSRLHLLLAWESQMINMIESFDLMGFLDGPFPMPMPMVLTTLANGSEVHIPNPNYQRWKESDRLLKGWITITLSEEVGNLIVGASRASKDRELSILTASVAFI